MIRKVLTFALVGVFAAAIPAFAQQPAAPPGGGAQGGGAPGGGDGRGRGSRRPRPSSR